MQDGDTIVLAPGVYDFHSTLHIVASRVTFVSPSEGSTFRFNHLDGDGVIVAGKGSTFKGITFDAQTSPRELSGANAHALICVIGDASAEFNNCDFANSSYGHSLISSGDQASASLFHCRISTQCRGAILATFQSTIFIDDSIVVADNVLSAAPIGILVENHSSLRMSNTEIRGNASISILIASGSSATLKKCKSISHSQRDALCAHGLGTCVSATECQFSNSTEANVAALFGAHLEADNCQFFCGMFQGCVVQGAGSAMHLRNCATRGTQEACVSVSRAGHFTAVDSSFAFSQQMQGIAAQGTGSSVELLSCQIDSCKGTCVLALTGAMAYLHDCQILNSTSMQGVCAEGTSSSVKMVRCQVKGTKEACVVAMHGGSVELDHCSLSNSISSRGLSVEGNESSAVLIDCKIKNCATAAVCVLNGAKIKIQGGTFSDCRSLEGQGMCVQGGGTIAEISNACFARRVTGA